MRVEKTLIQTLASQLSSTLMQLLFSFDQDTRREKTLIQTLACQLSSTLMQLLFSFDQDKRVEKTLIQTLACQLSSTLMQLLFSFDQDKRVEKTLIQTLACQLSSTLMQLLFSFDQDMRVEKTLIQTLASQLSFLSPVSKRKGSKVIIFVLFFFQIRTNRGTPRPYLSLPDEIILKIFCHLGHADLARCSRVCRHLERIAQDEILCKF